jgi:formylglycine-generating enzyme required for sulfatase activity
VGGFRLCVLAAICFSGSAEAEPEAGSTSEGLLQGMTFAWIPSGTFDMGSTTEESGPYSDEGPVHSVTIQGFEMMTTEVTQKMWEEVVGHIPSPDYGSGPDFPVYWTSWNDCQAFAEMLGFMDPEHEYRLPSEAEWEYACRAGTTTVYFWGDTMDGDYCWFAGNSGDSAHAVGLKLPNAWGLYDMSGNVSEWCEDWYHSSYEGSPDSGSPWLRPAGSIRVRRGGSWHFGERVCRSADRNFASPGTCSPHIGFRLIRFAEPSEADSVGEALEPAPGSLSPSPLAGMAFAWIPTGSFDMGSPESEPGSCDREGPVHRVEISGFELMTTEVTQGMWEEAMGTVPLQACGAGSGYPIGDIDEDQLQAFIDLLNSLDGEHEYRLPSEAEWEYACRAGTTTAYYWGAMMDDDYCWCAANSDGRAHPVALKLPNAWGLYDMAGNGYELCADKFHENYQGAPSDGRVWPSIFERFSVYRGGSWYYYQEACRSAARMPFEAGFPPIDILGFRLARSDR